MNRRNKILIFVVLCIIISSFNLNKVAMAIPSTDKVDLYLKIVSHQNASLDIDNSPTSEHDTMSSHEKEEFNITIEGNFEYKKEFVEEDETKYLELVEKEYKVSGGGSGSLYEEYNNLAYKTIDFRQYEKRVKSTSEKSWEFSINTNDTDYGDIVSSINIFPPDKKGDPPSYQINFDDSLANIIDSNLNYSGSYVDVLASYDGSETYSGVLDYDNMYSMGTFNNVFAAFTEALLIEGNETEFVNGHFKLEDGKYVASGYMSYDYNYSENEKGTFEVWYELNRVPPIKEIQVNQVLGRYEYISDEEYKPATDFVAGKDTAVQVFLNDDMNISNINDIYLDIYRDGNKIVRLTDFKEDKENNSAIFIPKSGAVCGYWKAGKYKFVAGIKENNLTLDNVKFKDRKKMNILAVPIKANYGGKITEPDGNWKKADSFLRRVYPLSNKNANWVIRDTLDSSNARYNLNSNEGMYKLWKRLNTLQPSSGAQYDAIIGFISDNADNGTAVGFTYVGGVATVVSTSSKDIAETVAHEIAHLFDVGDEYNGGSFNNYVNKPPYGYTGTNWFYDSTPAYGTDESIKPGPLNSGSLISENLHPFELGKRNLLKDKDSFMGASVGPLDVWITPDIWRRLFVCLEPEVTNKPSSSKASSNTQKSRVALVASGKINSSGEVEFELPWRSIVTTDEVEVQEGDYKIQALDSSGSVMAEQGFTPTYVMLSDPPVQLDEGLIIDVQLPLVEGTRKIQVMKDDTIVGNIPVSKGVPSISIISPQDGYEYSDSIPIEWVASDPDGDELYYTIEYSCDGEEWIVLESEFTESKLTQETGILPGGENSKIRVIASDGINTASAVSNIFTLPYNDMEVTIEEPIIEGATIFLQGRAYDFNEGGIYEDNLTWTSDKDGEIGKGSALNLELSKGKHIVTLSATNERDEQAEDSIEVNIEEESSGPLGWLNAIWQWIVKLISKIFKK